MVVNGELVAFSSRLVVRRRSVHWCVAVRVCGARILLHARASTPAMVSMLLRALCAAHVVLLCCAGATRRWSARSHRRSRAVFRGS